MSTTLRRGRSGSTPCCACCWPRGVLTLDELRRGIEELGPGAYDELSYFERWISSIGNLLLEKGVLHVQELGEAIDAAQQRHAEAGGVMSQRFPDGSPVRVKSLFPPGPLPHARSTPAADAARSCRSSTTSQIPRSVPTAVPATRTCRSIGSASRRPSYGRTMPATRTTRSWSTCSSLGSSQPRGQADEHAIDHDHPHRPDLEDSPLSWHMALTEAVHLRCCRPRGVQRGRAAAGARDDRCPQPRGRGTGGGARLDRSRLIGSGCWPTSTRRRPSSASIPAPSRSGRSRTDRACTM